jgi:hypothetical protein
MPTVGQKRGARLPQGPKPVDEVEDRVIDEVNDDIPDDPELESGTQTETGVAVAPITEGKKEEGDFSEIKRIKIPEPPTKLYGNWESYDGYQTKLTQEHWTTLLWYLYRSWPKIVRPENEGYIDKGSGVLQLSYILRKHGSGEYQVILNNPSMPKLQRKVTKVNFKLMDEENPPLLNMAELDVEYKGNKLFVDQCIARGLLTTEKKPMNSLQASGNGNQDQLVRLLEKIIDKKDAAPTGGKDPRDAALAEVITIMGKGNEASTKMLIEQMQSTTKENDPDRMLKLVTAIIDLTGKNQPPAQQGNGIDMFKVLELLSKKDEKILELIGRIAEGKGGSGSGDGGKEDSFDTFLDRMGKWNEAMGLAGGEGGSGRGGKKSTLEVILQYSMPAVEKALGLVQNLLYLKGQGVQPNPGGVGGGGQQQQQRHQPAPGLGPVAVTSPADGPQDVRDAMLGEAEANQVEIIKKGVRQLGPQIIAAMERGTEGDAFAESIYNFLGPMAYNQIAGLGEEKLIEYLQLEPAIWQRLQTVESALRIFIKEFIAFGSGDGGGEPTEDDLKQEAKLEEERKKQAAAFEGTGTGRRGVVS